MAVVVDSALSQLGIKKDFQIIGNPRAFADYGVSKNMTLMINDHILVEGHVPKIDEMLEILKSHLK